ncbi:MAG TPA: hypothetical protein VK665_01010 [Candidatus Elarobacter sp.]|nr:hypothetical protein [Candidatus Elarobacter sp.]
MQDASWLLDDAAPRAATITEATGVSRDGWCEPEVGLTIAAASAVALCQLRIWLKPEPARTSTRFVARFGDHEPFAFELPHDRMVVVHAACAAAPGEVVQGSIACDNEVSDKGIDVRRLSFKLDGIRFA